MSSVAADEHVPGIRGCGDVDSLEYPKGPEAVELTRISKVTPGAPISSIERWWTNEG